MKELNPPAIVVIAKESLDELARHIKADHEEMVRIDSRTIEKVRHIGSRLLVAREMVRSEKKKWLLWLKKNTNLSQPQAWRYMEAERLFVTNNFSEEQQLREWRKLQNKSPKLDAAADLVTDPESDDEEDDTMPLPMLTGYVTLSAWQEMGEDEQLVILDGAAGDKTFNAQGKNENIEWALWSWNPVTGCEHNCPYCYARDIANRFYEQKFEPSLWPDRLAAPANTVFPVGKIQESLEEGTREGRVRAYGLKNVFTCSMADLFGRWVPREWIDAVLDTVRNAPQWNFLFLTKFPQRMAEFEFPQNAWVGTSVDCKARVKNAEKAFRKIKAGVKWLSCEPLIEPLVFEDIGAFDWIVLGGASASAGTPEWKPPREWIHGIELAAAVAGVRVYEKSNLGIERRLREYPGLDLDNEALAPEALRYLPEVK